MFMVSLIDLSGAVVYFLLHQLRLAPTPEHWHETSVVAKSLPTTTYDLT